MMPVIIVHGGAASVPPDKQTLKVDGVKRAVNKGYDILLSPDGTALDAVEAAVKVMEDDPVFNAGLYLFNFINVSYTPLFCMYFPI